MAPTHIDDSKINNHEIQTINWKWKARNSQKNRQRDELVQGFIIVLKKSFFYINWHHYPELASAQITSMIDIKKYFSAGLRKYPNLYFTPFGYITRDQIVALGYNVTPENNPR